MPKSKISIRSIKAELEKLKTLDEKRQYLKSLLKSIKSEKLKLKVQKLLDEAIKHIEKHETSLTKEIPLEEKFAHHKEIPTDLSAGFAPEVKYVPKEQKIQSLEKEISRQPMWGAPAPTVGVKYNPPNSAYEHQQRVESLRFYLSEQQQLANKFTPDAWQGMPEERKRQVKDFITQSLGLTEISSIEANRMINTYINDIFSGGKPGEKYKTKL